MNEFTITFTLIEMIQYGVAIFSTGASIGYLFGKYLCNKEIKTSVLYDTCQKPLINGIGENLYPIQRFMVNDKCKDVVCEFLEDKTTCTLNKRKIKTNRGRCNYL